MPPQLWIIRALLQSGLIGSFDLKLSRLSGFVTDAGIGMPPQPIRMALDFTQSHLSLFLGTSCPLFITCYEPSQSLSLSQEGPEALVDELYLSGMPYPGRRFFSGAPGDSAALRDVAGTVGLGPSSALFHKRVLVLERSMAKIYDENSELIPTDGWIVASEFAHRWEFPALLVVPDESLQPREIIAVLDPSVSGVIVPEWSIGHTETRVIVGGISFYLDQVVVEVRKGDNAHITLGMMWIQSLDSLMLNYATRSVRITPILPPRHRKDPGDTKYEEIPLPLFHPPMVTDHTILLNADKLAGSWILASKTGMSTVDPIDQTVWLCWALYSFQDVAGEGFLVNERIAGKFGPFIRLDVSRSEIRFQFSLASSEAPLRDIVITRKDGNAFTICIPDDFNRFDLPDPRMLTMTADATVCVICCDDLLSGEIIQEMQSCRHSFHARCVKPWICRKAECPTCRAPIQVKKESRGYYLMHVLNCIIS